MVFLVIFKASNGTEVVRRFCWPKKKLPKLLVLGPLFEKNSIFDISKKKSKELLLASQLFLFAGDPHSHMGRPQKIKKQFFFFPFCISIKIANFFRWQAIFFGWQNEKKIKKKKTVIKAKMANYGRALLLLRQCQ